MDHGEGDVEKVWLRAFSDQLLCSLCIQICRVEVSAVLGNLGAIPQVVTSSSCQATLAAPVVHCSGVGAKEGVKTTIGRRVPGVTVTQMPFAFTYLHLTIGQENLFATSLQGCLPSMWLV